MKRLTSAIYFTCTFHQPWKIAWTTGYVFNLIENFISFNESLINLPFNILHSNIKAKNSYINHKLWNTKKTTLSSFCWIMFYNTSVCFPQAVFFLIYVHFFPALRCSVIKPTISTVNTFSATLAPVTCNYHNPRSEDMQVHACFPCLHRQTSRWLMFQLSISTECKRRFPTCFLCALKMFESH